jgi:hypothetical protein
LSASAIRCAPSCRRSRSPGLSPAAQQEGEGPQQVLTEHRSRRHAFRDDAGEPALMLIMFAQLGDDEKAEFFVGYDTNWT